MTLPYTEGDVQRVAEASYESDNYDTPGAWHTPWADAHKRIRHDYERAARAALNALAAAERLRLPGAVPVAEWEIRNLLVGRAEAAERERDRNRHMVDDAREVVRRLVHMEREHLGTGPEGHLSERDLAPLLHALHIDPEETE